MLHDKIKLYLQALLIIVCLNKKITLNITLSETYKRLISFNELQ